MLKYSAHSAHTSVYHIDHIYSFIFFFASYKFLKCNLQEFSSKSGCIVFKMIIISTLIFDSPQISSYKYRQLSTRTLTLCFNSSLLFFRAYELLEGCLFHLPLFWRLSFSTFFVVRSLVACWMSFLSALQWDEWVFIALARFGSFQIKILENI